MVGIWRDRATLGFRAVLFIGVQAVDVPCGFLPSPCTRTLQVSFRMIVASAGSFVSEPQISLWFVALPVQFGSDRKRVLHRWRLGEDVVLQATNDVFSFPLESMAAGPEGTKRRQKLLSVTAARSSSLTLLPAKAWPVLQR